MSMHTRYERLNSKQDDFQRFAASAAADNEHDHDDDDDDEEIELGHEHNRLRYTDVQIDAAAAADGVVDKHNDVDDRYANGAALGKSIASGALNALESGGSNAMSAHRNQIGHLPGSRLMQMAIGTLLFICLYLILSISLTFYQKALIHKLNFPLSIVCYHLMIKYMLAYAFRALYKWHTGKTRVQIDWRLSVRRMAPTGIASGVDIGFSQWGLHLVSVSLYTMAKSSAIVFILFFAILLGLEKKSISLVFIVGLIASGLLMFTYKSTQFNALGFVFILVASLSSGVRWSLAQLVMQKSKLGLHNPVDMIFHMQPWMLAILLPLGISIEGQNLYAVLRDLQNIPVDVIYTTMLSVTFGAIIAFCMEVSEFLVLSQTSSLTLSIAGIFKDICQVTLAVMYNGDKLSTVNILGLVVLLGGILLHVVHKYSVMVRQEAELSAFNDVEDHRPYIETPPLSGSQGGGGGDAGISNMSMSALIAKSKHSAQTVPLLEQSDTEESLDGEDHNNSDVIFDVLKRRDMTR